jgi:hypothetical protein
MSYPRYSTQQAQAAPSYLQIMRGPQGPQGPPGPPGSITNLSTPSIGTRGATGERGERGERGETGKKGETGERGERGETGPSVFDISGTIFGDYIFWNDNITPPQWSIGSRNITLGFQSGKNNQGPQSVAIGSQSATSNQSGYAVAIGNQAGHFNQGQYSIAIGHQSGLQDQSANSIVLNATGSPLNAGTTGFFVAPIRDISSNLILVYNSKTKEITYTNSSYITGPLNAVVNALNSSNVALGDNAGRTSQSSNAIAIGAQAGNQIQGAESIAIGAFAGYSNQLLASIAIGPMAGNENQGVNAIAIGDNAGWDSQNDNAIAIGTDAGNMNQGSYSIAIGYQSGNTNQSSNSIIINATGDELNADTSGCFIAPIRGGVTGPQVLYYEPETKEITYSSPKSFIIDHPLDEEKYLVHACLEGPEAGVYYRGIGVILPNHKFTIIHLPHYVQAFSKNFTIQTTRIIEDKDQDEYQDEDFSNLKTSLVINNSFKVFGTPGKFFWHVYGERATFEIEPHKKDVKVKGDGPYKWI